MTNEPYLELEQQWAKWNNLDPAGMVACSSGTAALHLALEAMELPLGSEVICPDLTMVAVPRAVVLAGHKPVFVDCDKTLNMDANLVTNYCLQACPETLIFVHTYGRQANVTDVDDFFSPMICGPRYIEDLAEAHGVAPHPATDAATWSYYRNKIVHGEEGGAVWFKNNEHAKLARQLRSLGFTDAHDFTHIPRGHNYRMSNAHASLVLDSLSRYRENFADRWRQMEQLDSACPTEWKLAPRSAPWVYDFRIPELTSEKQDEIVAELNKIGITARHCFKPMHTQREFAGCKLIRNATGSEALAASREVIYVALVPHRPRIDQIVFRRIHEILVDKA